jgi:flagellar biosynthetic protein FlhB/type III secretion protein U
VSDKDSGDKTEKPTPKRLEDARKKGDVAKSKEVTSTIVLMVWLALGAMTIGFASTRFAMLWDSLFITIGQGWHLTGFAGAARSIGAQSFELALMLTAMLLVPAAAVGMLTDFLQHGPILTFEKLKPKLDNMNPVEGVKRMFTLDNLIEVVKAVVKTTILFVMGWLVIKSSLPDIIGLARSPTLGAQTIGALLWGLTLKMLAWTCALFALLAMLDWVYQRWSFEKKMRMSMRDIKQESKESEGDPYIKGQRKQLAQEWSQRSQQQAAASANVLIVNPTHVAIAIEYDPETAPVPTISAKGEDHVALAMRQAAEDAHVPIVRNIPLARDLLARGEVGEVIPADAFDVIAEVILWARQVRAQVEAQRQGELADLSRPVRRIAAPGEDLTHYPDPTWNRSH